MNAAMVLVADDDAVTRTVLVHHLETAGYRTVVAVDGKQAMAALSTDLAVALLDLQMPGASGLECLRYAQEHCPDVAVLVISQFGEIRDAVEAMKNGAFEYVTKPIEPEQLLAHVRQAERASRLTRENRQLREAVSSPMPPVNILGSSPFAQRLSEQAVKVARIDASVLITGESGTGKTTLARQIHQLGPRASAPFVVVNCGSLPRDLIEAELFGHVKGAFTGAINDRPGRAEMADGGTLFLDEIGDLPLELQPKLLAFLQDRKVERIGDTRVRQVDVRVIAATHQDLEKKCTEGTFRSDLYFRLNVLPLRVLPLRERRDDIPELLDSLLTRIAAKRQSPPFQIEPEARNLLVNYAWPGNIRELENVLERSTAFCTDQTITRDDLGLQPLTASQAGIASEATTLAGLTWEEIEKRALLDTLQHCQGNKREAARMLGIDEKSVYNKLKRLQITAPSV